MRRGEPLGPDGWTYPRSVGAGRVGSRGGLERFGAEAAYEKAVEEAANDSDVNFDGPGNRNLYHTLGLHELEEYPCAENFSGDLERRGVWITAIDPSDVDGAGVPRVRAKDELDIFRLPLAEGHETSRRHS